MSDIEPTHHCFDDALDWLGVRVRAGGRYPELVHAICRGTDPDGREVLYAHAWVEEDGYVWDSGLLNGQRIAYKVVQLQFYAARRVTRTWRYTLLEALRANRTSGTYGPWAPEVAALCGPDRRILGRIPATGGRS